MFTTLVVFAIILLVYYFLIKPQLYWKSKNVQQGPPIPIFGDQFKATFRMESIPDMVMNTYNKYKDQRYFGIYQATIPTFVLRDPELIKQITVKDFDHFVDHMKFANDDVDPIWNKNLFSLNGDKWREMRATLSPTFTGSKMKLMFELMEKSAEQYVNFYLTQNKNTVELELKDSFTRFANDVIANCAFGITVDSLKEPNNIFYLNGKEITNFTGFWKNFKFFVIMMLPKLASILKISIFAPGMAEFYKTIVQDTVKVREEQKIIRPDMINLLMEARKGKLQYEESSDKKDAGFATVEESKVGKVDQNRNFAMTEEDMAAQVLIFFFAGFDTISTVMCLMYYELAVNPDIQEKLRAEVDETYEENKGKLTYDILSKMKYLDMVLSESLRLHPPVPSIDRVCTKSYTIKPEKPGEQPVTLKVGEVLWLPIMGLHHDEEYYPEPKKFNPERFSDENKSNIQPYTYIPFGAGPRNCIGSRFALMEVKTLLCHVLRKFEIVVIEKTPIPLKYDRTQFGPAVEGGCWVGFKRRDDLN